LKASFEEAVELGISRRCATATTLSVIIAASVEARSENTSTRKSRFGLYEYVVGSLPLPGEDYCPARLVIAAEEARARDAGTGREEGRWSQDDAKTVLVLLYTREKRFAEVVKLTARVEREVSRNYLLKLRDLPMRSFRSQE
jgi:hypothetical protein